MNLIADRPLTTLNC